MSKAVKRTIRQETTVTLDLAQVERVLRELAGAPVGADVRFLGGYDYASDIENVTVTWTVESVEEHGE